MSVCFSTPAMRRKSTGVISCGASLLASLQQQVAAEVPKLDRIDLATLLHDAS